MIAVSRLLIATRPSASTAADDRRHLRPAVRARGGEHPVVMLADEVERGGDVHLRSPATILASAPGLSQVTPIDATRLWRTIPSASMTNVERFTAIGPKPRTPYASITVFSVSASSGNGNCALLDPALVRVDVLGRDAEQHRLDALELVEAVAVLAHLLRAARA